MQKLINRGKKFYISVISCFFPLFNFFYSPFLLSSLRNAIDKLPRGTQLFIFHRIDFGTLLVLLNYVRDWEEQYGQTAVVILSPLQKTAEELFATVSPKTKTLSPSFFILRLFGKITMHFKCYSKVMAKLLWEFPSTRFLYYENSRGNPNFPRTNYAPQLDVALTKHQDTFPPKFLECYQKHQSTIAETHKSFFPHYVQLHYENDIEKRRSYQSEVFPLLKKNLGLTKQFVLLNLPMSDSSTPSFRRICHPERYNALIDFLIEQGYEVVLQGREEQPFFTKRQGLIDYAHSIYTAPLHDLQLYSHATFAIIPSTGSEIFAQLTHLPVLNLNNSELWTAAFNPKSRFFPKKILDTRSNTLVSWQTLLTSPLFFEIAHRPSLAHFAYLELDETEILTALQEFLILLKNGQWSVLTHNQKKFKSSLTPLHLDLFLTRSLPCDCYLGGAIENSSTDKQYECIEAS